MWYFFPFIFSKIPNIIGLVRLILLFIVCLFLTKFLIEKDKIGPNSKFESDQPKSSGGINENNSKLYLAN